MNDQVLRDNLVEALTKEVAYISPKKALEDLKPENRTKHQNKNSHSVWDLFEHIRISQEDILRYTLDPNWISPSWPEGHWPPPNQKVTDEMWDSSIKKFFSDLDEVVSLAKNKKYDLTSEIPHGEVRTYLREILLVIAHNSYHLGQLIQTRKELGDWKF